MKLSILFILALISPKQSNAVGEIKNIVSEGLRNGFEVKTQKLSLEQQMNSNRNVQFALLPTFSLSAGRSISKSQSISDGLKTDSKTESNTLSLSSDWTLWNNYQNIRDIQVSNLETKSAVISTDDAIQRYILNVIDSYLNYQLLINSKVILENNLEQANWTYEETAALVKVGNKPDMDSINSEIEVINLKRDLLELNNTLETTDRDLKFLLNAEDLTELPRFNILKNEPYFMSLFEKKFAAFKGEWNKIYRQKNRTYRTSMLNLEASKQQLDQTKLGYWPSLSLSLSHSINFDNEINSDVAAINQEPLSASSISFNVSWTFWDWWSTPRNIANSMKAFESSRISFRQEVYRLETEIRNNIQQYDLLSQSVKASKLILKKSEKQLEYTKEMYKLGRSSWLNLQQATNSFFSARNGLAQRLKDRYVLAAKILFLMGEDLKPTSKQI